MEYSARQRRHPPQRRLSPDLDLKLTERCLVLMQKAASPLASASNLADGRRGQWLAGRQNPPGVSQNLRTCCAPTYVGAGLILRGMTRIKRQ